MRARRLTLVTAMALVTLSACNLPGGLSVKRAGSTKSTKPALVPFGSITSDPGSASSDPSAVATPGASDPNIIQARAIDTSPTTTSMSQNPLCQATKAINTLNARFATAISKALSGSFGPRTLVRTLQNLPATDLGNAYDDLSAAVPLASQRRKVATVRNFSVGIAQQLTQVQGTAGLSTLLASMEANPQTSAAAAADASLSVYTMRHCNAALSELGVATPTPTTVAN
jgi:hypothetical protein